MSDIGGLQMPYNIYFVFKPYGAQRLFVEPQKVLDEWLEQVAQGKGPIFYHSVTGAIADQLKRSPSPDVKIDPFCVVSIAMSIDMRMVLGRYVIGEGQQLHEGNGLLSSPYCRIHRADAVEKLRRILMTPGYVGLQMRMFTHDSALVVQDNGEIPLV